LTDSFTGLTGGESIVRSAVRTDVAITEATPLRASPDVPPPRRGLGGRLSAGHLVMVTAALLAVVGNLAVLRARDETQRVAIAAEDIAAGGQVTTASFALADVDVGPDLLPTLLPLDGIRSVDGWTAANAIAAGDLVRRSDLRAPSAPSDKRAMSIPIAPEHAAGGAIGAGDRVDVIVSHRGRASYVVTDAEVLAVGPQDGGRGLAASGGYSVTVAVDDRDALELAAALRAEGLEIVRATGSTPAEAGPAGIPGTPPADEVPGATRLDAGPPVPSPDAAPSPDPQPPQADPAPTAGSPP
jgi:Flp pilus assembly protein CpaB